MLPKGFDLDNLDDGIRNLVITLNKIPEVNKKTTPYGPTSCEGHVYEGWTKDGWIYFYKPLLKRTGLIKRMNQFCKDYPYFKTDLLHLMGERDFLEVGLEPNQNERFGFYQICGRFESEDESKMPSHYFGEEADMSQLLKRRTDLLAGWNELDSRIKDYIVQNITRNIQSLQYISNEEEKFVPPMCPHACY